MSRTDEIGAAAAARYFVSLYSYTLGSGDVTAWDTISHADCGFCAGIRDDAVTASRQGERYDGGVIALSEIVVLPRDDLVGGFPVQAQYTQGDEILRDADGNAVATTPSNSGTVRIDTLPTDAGWKILAVVVDGD